MSTHPRLYMDVLPLKTVRRFVARGRSRGFTLLELMCAVALVILLATVAVPTYRSIIERQKIQQARNDLMQIALAIERYRGAHNFTLPNSLAEALNPVPQDPWGNPYQYLNFSSGEPGVNGKIRKDRNLHPLNSEFDLYSMGADGESVPPLTAKASQDDVLWARDGSFIDVASDF